jgi:hypothetical protein
MRFVPATRGKAWVTLIGAAVAAGIAGPVRADPPGGGRVVTVKNADTVIVEDNGRIIYISSPHNRSASRQGAGKRVEYAGIGTQEAIRRHNEVVGQLMDNPVRPVECR